jgi:4-amino-4-deoxy-L-arabinose transferase-like glycosyltransferase
MRAVSVNSPRFLGMSPAIAAGTLIAAATLVRFFLATWLPLLPDEAYYWQWSRHLDVSYFSKGPAVAYTIAAGTALFGDTNLGIRFFAVALSAGTAWQVFLLARRWYDETTALIAVLLVGVVPLYAVGAVVMTIDPLSAFFWVWAANFFSRAVLEGRWTDWLLTGFAVGSGFLAKYLNALELLAFLAFLLCAPARRRWLARPHFWAMLGVAIFCTLPVLWWNHQHGWVSAGQLKQRGGLNGPFSLHYSTFLDFLGMQAAMVSPLLFVALLALAIGLICGCARRKEAVGEGDLLLLFLFLSVFLFYAVLSWHLRGEPNWPAVSYLSLFIVLAARWRSFLEKSRGRGFMIAAFLFAWAESLFLYDTRLLHLPPRLDPMGRVVGWTEIAEHLNQLRHEQQADVLIADAYKEASIFSFHLPDKKFIYTKKHVPPANQFDFWQPYPTAPPVRALWITGDDSPRALASDFNTITPIERVVVSFRGKPFREYTIYRCENSGAGSCGGQ